MGKIPDKKFPVKIAGFPLPLYLGILALVIVCMYTGCLPGGIVGGMIFLMVLGEGLNAIGNSVPVVKTYLGGSVICILGAAVIQAAGLIPEQTHAIIDNFVNQEGFLVFYISALITGSLFNIDRDLLIRATVKLLPTAVIALAVGVTLSGVLGMFMGNSFLEGILYIGIPMTSGRDDSRFRTALRDVFIGSRRGRRGNIDTNCTGYGTGKLCGHRVRRPCR